MIAFLLLQTPAPAPQVQSQVAVELPPKMDALIKSKDWAGLAEAEPVLRAALAKDPKIAYAWNNLGRCLNEKKAWIETCEALDKALLLEPNQFEALFNRGRCFFELKRYKESREDFHAALALQPGDPVITETLRQAERHAVLPTPKQR
jgi:tetratricopeptide (TPR) repeat protein